ncbi:MAG: isoleucine--tRNA ligase [Gemmatimonadales bacterium]
MTYEPLGSADLSDLELEVLELWRSEDLFHRTLKDTCDGKPFVFYEGPPTANGRPGIHHVFARAIKDLICRYHTMLGDSVTRIAGWDTHGLPVEIEVEKELNISGKADIERYGVAAFNRKSKESVFRYKADWETLSERIGYWLDYERPYVTYTNDYIESVWWLLKQLAEKDLLYEGHKVLPYCIRCGTTLSSHELAMGYETHKSPSIHVLFHVVGVNEEHERFLLVWTTTPWTLPSNVAVAVNPHLTYVELEIEDKRVIVEQSIARYTAVPGATGGRPLGEFPVVATYKGTDLVGWRYQQLIDAVKVGPDGRAFEVLAGDFVTSEEGTGLVHIAPAFGADDYSIGQSERLAFVNPVNSAGKFVNTGWAEINGKTVFEANPVIAARLEEEGKLFGRYQPQGYEHTYPFCWRCDSPLIYYARKSWFVRTTAFKERMIELNNQVNWYPPEVGTGRFGEWLENNVDWALSRDRYWGTPLPVWTCDANDSHRLVVGSYEELATACGEPLPEDFDPHKPHVDEITFPCSSCEGAMRRDPGVIDAWFDSGSMPYAQWHYPFENEAEFGAHFPADFICEGLDQTRGWFYSLLALAAGVHDSTAYRNVIVNGLVLDAEGRKMSKRVGNVVNPSEAVDRFGADAVRLYLLAGSQVWLPKKFDERAIPEVSLGFLNQLRNTYAFFSLYAEDWDSRDAPGPKDRPAVDRWLLSRLDAMVGSVRAAWDGFDVTSGVRAIMEFCDSDLSNWYVRINRARFWAPDASADRSALATLHEALTTVCRLLAPAAPFLSDAIHRRLTGKSVHLMPFPSESGMRQEPLDRAMAAVRSLATLARSAREEGGLKGRQPLANMRVAVPEVVRGDTFDNLLQLLAKEVNVRGITVVESDESLVKLRAKPNYRSLGKVYGRQTPAAAELAGKLTPEQLRRLEAGERQSVESNGGTYSYGPDDIVVEREVVTDWLVQSDGPFVTALDPHLNEELEQEGMARELVNRVQRLRKAAGYDYDTRIELGLSGSQGALAAAEAHDTFIARETLARRVEVGADLPDPDVSEVVDIDGRRVVVSLKRYDHGQ